MEYITFIEKLLNKCNKAELLRILDNQDFKGTKAIIIEAILNGFQDAPDRFKSFYDEYSEYLALTWKEVEEILDCSKQERLDWTKNELLKVHHYDEIRKFGTIMNVPKYDLIAIFNSKDKVNQWRITREKESALIKEINVKKGKEKAKLTREINKKAIEEFEDEFIETKKIWLFFDKEFAITMELAFWTMWISRWAKEYQVKSINSNRIEFMLKYKERSKELYSMKNAANHQLSLSKYAKLSFYESENPHKFELYLCQKHYDEWLKEREFRYIPLMSFFSDHEKDIISCEKCSCEHNEYYYSLYYVEIGHESIQNKYSFHIPYPIGVEFLPEINSLFKVYHEEKSEGTFRFGRTLLEDEKIILSEARVIKKFHQAMDEYNKLCSE